MSKSRGSPRKFAEKIALLNKKEAEGTSEFEKILKEVKETTRAPCQSQQYWGLPARSSSFSDWQTFDPNVQQQQQQAQYQHPSGSQYLTTTQHVQFPNQLQKTRQHVLSTTRQSPILHDHRRRQHQQQLHHAHHRPQHQHQRLQSTTYVSHQSSQPSEYVNILANDQQISHRTAYVKSSTGSLIQPISIEVPNIEIFPIDDDYQQQQLVGPPSTPGASPGGNDLLSNGHHRNDCSNLSISSSRSLPNIANLSVSPSSPGHQMTTQPVTNQRLGPFSNVDTHLAASPTTAATTALTTIVTSTINNNDDCYPTNSARIDYVNNDDYCSLPTINHPMPTINRHDQGRQSQSHIPLSESWQQVPSGRSPSSTAAASPSGTVQESSYNQQQSPQQHSMVHSPDSSPHRPQHSPQTLHQDYYPSPIQDQGQLMRANSTNIINKYPINDLLEAPRIDGNLSKSTDASYGGYMDSYTTNNEFCNGFEGGNGNNVSDNNLDSLYVTTTNQSSPITRSRSENNIENMNATNDYQFTNNYVVINQPHFIDASQGQLYE